MPLDVGISSAKQYQAAVALLQCFQETIMYGDMKNTFITRAKCVKLALQHVKKSENTRRHANFVDAAASENPLLAQLIHAFTSSLFRY